MKKKTETRGRKSNEEKGQEKKINTSVYLHPTQINKIIKKHKSLNQALEILAQ